MNSELPKEPILAIEYNIMDEDLILSNGTTQTTQCEIPPLALEYNASPSSPTNSRSNSRSNSIPKPTHSPKRGVLAKAKKNCEAAAAACGATYTGEAYLFGGATTPAQVPSGLFEMYLCQNDTSFIKCKICDHKMAIRKDGRFDTIRAHIRTKHHQSVNNNDIITKCYCGMRLDWRQIQNHLKEHQAITREMKKQPLVADDIPTKSSD